MFRLATYARAFTLIEIMIVVSIIGILATVVGFSVRDSSAQSRDAQRQADLRNLQTAIELYKKDNGRYPEGCRGPNTWSGQIGSEVPCSSGSRNYIKGSDAVPFVPKYIKALPFEKKLNGINSGYMYTVNSDGSVYKARAYRTVESEVVTFEHPLKACDIRADLRTEGLNDREVIGWCSRLREGWLSTTPIWANGGQIRRPHSNCNPDLDSFFRTYAVWGGFAPKGTMADTCGATPNCEPNVIKDTASVICR